MGARLAQSGGKRYSVPVGFYLELSRANEGPEYRENFIPFVYFGLLGFAALALVGMAAAAHTVLADLVAGGTSIWDRVLVFGPLACVPVLLGMTIKLGAMRKFVRFEGNKLSWGSRLFGRPFRVKMLGRPGVASFELVNQRPKANLAHVHHDNPAYYVRGHWRLVVKTKEGAEHLLDRHTEREALLPLYDDLQSWLTP